MTRFHCCIATAVLLATPAYAGPISVNSTATGADESVFFPTGSAGGVLNFQIRMDPFTSTSPDDPMAGAQGTCFGVGTSAGGLTHGEGYCDYADGMGEHFVLRWTMEPTKEIRGSWQLAGGTGRWQTAVGGGYFWDTMPGPATHFVGQVEFH